MKFEIELHAGDERFNRLIEFLNSNNIDYSHPHVLLQCSVGSSTLSKELLECTVCWGGGKVEVDDLGNDQDCTWCNGTVR